MAKPIQEPMQQQVEGAGSVPATMPQAIMQVMSRPAYVVNILGGDPWIITRTYGTFVIAACEEGEPYKVTTVTSRRAPRDLGDKRIEADPVLAAEIAADLVREINSEAGEHSFFGVFVSPTPVPSERALAEARRKYTRFCQWLVQQGDGAWARFKNPAMIADPMRRAAKFLNLQKEWAYDPEPNLLCPACGKSIPPGVVKCATCGAILDEEKARKYHLLPETEPAKPKRAAGEA
jgi:hypothetical protein